MSSLRLPRRTSNVAWEYIVLAFGAGFMVSYMAFSPTETVLTTSNILGFPTPSKGVSLSPGWKNINVFYHKEEALGYENKKSFSQAGQDLIILDLIGENGFFIDLASNDAVVLSNTLALEKRGWNG